MIGHYLLTLTPDQEARVLTRAMEPFPMSTERCLVQTACPGIDSATAERGTHWNFDDSLECYPQGGIRLPMLLGQRPRPNNFAVGFKEPDQMWAGYRLRQYLYSPATAYDHLCYRFGVARVNAAIRNRILSNQARRALAAPLVEAV